jgi:hypothetical protein
VGKIFEALQYAQSERQQRDKLAQQHLDPFKQNVQTVKTDLLSPAIMKQTSCNCLQHGYRIPRRGTWGVLYRFVGLYPWRCAECNRRFHRFQRS